MSRIIVTLDVNENDLGCWLNRVDRDEDALPGGWVRSVEIVAEARDHNVTLLADPGLLVEALRKMDCAAWRAAVPPETPKENA